jgi:hypothetical protein
MRDRVTHISVSVQECLEGVRVAKRLGRIVCAQYKEGGVAAPNSRTIH